MIGSGNTLIKVAQTAKEQGAKRVYAYCTHGIFSGNARERISKEIDLMIVSNSIY
jgi:ribose-phosphate pyrophosphokinase